MVKRQRVCEKKRWEKRNRDPNPTSNFVNNGCRRWRTNEWKWDQSEHGIKRNEDEKSRLKRMWHSFMGTYLSGVYVGEALAPTCLPFKVKLRLIQSLSHDITFRGISVYAAVTLTHTLAGAHTFSVCTLLFILFFSSIPICALSTARKREESISGSCEPIVQQSSAGAIIHDGGDLLAQDRCGCGASNKRPRVRLHFAFISVLVSIHDVFISVNQNAHNHEKTSSCRRVISLTFRRSIDDGKKIITIFFFLSSSLARCFSHLHIWIFYHHVVGSLRIYSRTMGKVEKSNQSEENKTPLSLVFLCSQPSARMDLIWAPNVYTRSTHHSISAIARPVGCEFPNCSRKNNARTANGKKCNLLRQQIFANGKRTTAIRRHEYFHSWFVFFLPWSPFTFPFAPWTGIESEWCVIHWRSFQFTFSPHNLSL